MVVVDEPLQLLTEAELAEAREGTGRKCGDCSLCCLLLNVPEAQKPRHDWCPHCRPGNGGCAIYDTRPEVCRRYACMWLINESIPEDWKPTRSKLVLDMHSDPVGRALRVFVHPKHPNRWREQPYLDGIRKMALNGLRGTPMHYRTVIVQDDKWTHIVLPHKSVPFGPGITLPFGKNHWEFIAMKSDEDVKKLMGDKLIEVVEIGGAILESNPNLSALEAVSRAIEMITSQP